MEGNNWCARAQGYRPYPTGQPNVLPSPVARVSQHVPAVFTGFESYPEPKEAEKCRQCWGFSGWCSEPRMMSAFTEGKHRALKAAAFLIVVLSEPTVSEAQTRRDSLVNPGQSGPQGIVGGQPGPSVGRTQPSFGVLPSIDFGPADPSNLKVPRTRTAQDLPLPLDPDPQRPRPGLPALKPVFGKPDGITLDMAIDILFCTTASTSRRAAATSPRRRQT